MRDYLLAYKEKYGYDSVFLISTRTNRYYHFDNGVDTLQGLFRSYEESFQIRAYLVDEKGMIEISTDKTGYTKTDLSDMRFQTIQRKHIGQTSGHTSLLVCIRR